MTATGTAASGTPGPEAQRSSNSDGSESLVDISGLSIQPPKSPRDDFEHLSLSSSRTSDLPHSASSTSADRKARLIYCKSHVAIHPTTFNKDNISGYLGIVEIDTTSECGPQVETDGEGNVKTAQQGKKELLVTWVPNELLDRMDEEDREGYRRVDGRFSHGTPKEQEEDGFVFVSVPPPKGEKYAFAVPVASLYSILVYPPSLSHWYGSATFNLTGGVSLPTLYFHDDESPLLNSPTPASTAQPTPRAQWGFPPFLTTLQSSSTTLRSRLLNPRTSHGAELWLINPSKADREVHEVTVDEPLRTQSREQPRRPSDSQPRSPASPTGNNAVPYPPRAAYPSAAVLGATTPKQSLLTSLSNLTNLSRKTAQQVLAHPLAQPVLPHLPPAVRSFVNVPGEWERPGRRPPRTGRGGEVENEFDSARLYLARWARVVAEEGERARRTEVVRQADIDDDVRIGSEDLASSLGVFSLLTSPNSKRPIPHPTRTPHHPITARDWESFADQGRDELYVRREIFKRGFSDSQEPEEARARREGWEVLLGVVPWSIGGIRGDQEGRLARKQAREALRHERREEYAKMKKAWKEQLNRGLHQEDWKEEWHRIDVDCRRTDRTQSIYAVPPEAVKRGEEEKEAGGAGAGWDGIGEEEEGGMAGLNMHIAALRTILMTYHTQYPALGYVQGMSDLLSPIYIVFDNNEADAYWGLVGVMRMMETNFLRDQSGMKRQLSTLQQLIAVMDPELHAHLDRTGSLNLFFCFRWILIAFKREFKFGDVIRLWEVLWTNYYSTHFVLFVALAVLQSHRDVILRYLTEFDEVLKYANDLSGTIDLDTTLAQAEVLFLSFRALIEDVDHDNAADVSGDTGLRRRRGSQSSHKSATALGEDKAKPRLVSTDLRDLLKHWSPDSDGVVRSQSAIVDESSPRSNQSGGEGASSSSSTSASAGGRPWAQNAVPSFM